MENPKSVINCAKKVQYRSLAKARRKVVELTGQIGRLRTYRCGVCKKWHLTSKGTGLVKPLRKQWPATATSTI